MAIPKSVMGAGWAVHHAVVEWSLRRRRGPFSVFALGFSAVLLVPHSANAEEPGRARAKQLLTLATESARDQWVHDATEALAFGVTFTGAGVASWVTESRPSAREARDLVGGVLVGMGGLMLAGGALSLAAAVPCEDETRSQTVAQIERQLFAREKEAKMERRVSAVTSFVFGAVEIGGGIALEVAAEDHGLKWLGRGLMAGGVGAGILGVGTLAIRSEEERLADLWRMERATPSATSPLRIAPRIGFGSAGIAGTF